MHEPSGSTGPYRFVYSEFVRVELIRLLAKARDRGLGTRFLAAVKETDRRLHIYPQFGEPLCVLKMEPAQLWIGVVGPLTVRYVLDESQRLVMIATPFLPLPRSGL